MGKYVDKDTFVNFCLARGFYPGLIKRALEDCPAADVVEVKADTLKDIQIKFAMHFGTYTGDAEVKVSEVFKLLSKFKEEMLEGEI